MFFSNNFERLTNIMKTNPIFTAKNSARETLWTTLALAFTLFVPALNMAQAQEESAEKSGPQSIFPDKNLEAAVRKAVFSKRYTDEPILAEDVAQISTIQGVGMGIQDLTGLEHCRRLASLDLSGNEIASLKPLENLTELQYLNLDGNRIQDIAPIAGLIGLQYLELSNNLVRDIEPLKNLTRLNSLYLSDNQIMTIQPLLGMKKLWSLYLDYNGISDLTGIGELENLSTLSLKNNQISDLAPLAPLNELGFLFLENNQIRDLSSLIKMAKADREGSRRFAPFWKIYLGQNPLRSRASSQQIEELRSLVRLVEF